MSVEPISASLLHWYDANARQLPWRQPPNTVGRPDPYGVWLSEIMLQQTTVVMAAPYWKRFKELWPTVHDLAATEDANVMREWAGLGYYARARNLLAAARRFAAEGFPETEEELRGFPGLGDYTAAAVASIAFGQPTIAIDANVARVGARLFALPDPTPAGRKPLKAKFLPHVPADRPGDFLQALMDLGSTLCTPRNPKCLLCPLQSHCAAFKLGDAESYPAPKVKKEKVFKDGLAWWIVANGQVALVRRPEKGMLGGMLSLPGTEWSAGAARRYPFAGDWKLLNQSVRHVFTHFELQLSVAAVEITDTLTEIEGQPVIWTPIDQIETAGLPTLYARAAQLVGESA